MLLDLNNKLVNTNLIIGLTMSDSTPYRPDPKGRTEPYIHIKQLGTEDIDIAFSSLSRWENACNILMSFLKDHGDFADMTLEI